MAFPNNVLALADAAGSNFLNVAWGGVTAMSTGLNLVKASLIATQKRLGTGTQTAPARGQALIGQGVADSDSNQQSIWDTHARRNRIVNGLGRTKQRATMPTADNSYGFDRWRVLMENANGCTLTQEVSDLPIPGPGTAMRLTVGSGNNGKFGHWQPILFADCRDLAGKAVSLRADLKASNAREANTRMAVAQFVGTADAISGDPVSTWGADGTNPTLATNWSFANTPASKAITTSYVTYYVENISISASAVNLAVFVWNDARTTTAADYIEMTNVQLEEGAVSTAVEITPEAQERMICRDWYREYGGDATNQIFGSGAGVDTTHTNCFVPFEPMRTVPAVSFSAATDFQVFAASGITGSAISATNIAKQATQVAMTHAGSGAGAAAFLLQAVSTSARIKMTSEP